MSLSSSIIKLVSRNIKLTQAGLLATSIRGKASQHQPNHHHDRIDLVSKYTQGQEFDNAREYFYYIDHHGQLFLDDTRIKNFTTCYKEKKFLEFFFKNLRVNESDRFKDFKFISYCGRERNYLKCEDLPFVVTHLDQLNDMVQLNYINSAHWLFHFDPKNLSYNPDNGRMYYTFGGKQIINNTKSSNESNRLKHLDKLPIHIGLVKSELNIYLMEKVRRVKDNQHEAFKFNYKNKEYELASLPQDMMNFLKQFRDNHHE